jgi:hypothetical protein
MYRQLNLVGTLNQRVTLILSRGINSHIIKIVLKRGAADNAQDSLDFENRRPLKRAAVFVFRI